MNSEFDLSSIKPLVSNDLLKTVVEELDIIICKIAVKYKISLAELKDFVRDDISKIGIKMGIKKRNRRVLPPHKQCMGRKLDGNQCTRGRYKECSEYCKSHANKLPLGRIDDKLEPKEHLPRGRKKKLGRKSVDYIVTKIETIGESNYLVDDRNMVFSFDTNEPRFLGVKSDNTIKTLTDLGIVVSS
jgi:hypothetical protein